MVPSAAPVIREISDMRVFSNPLLEKRMVAALMMDSFLDMIATLVKLKTD